MHTFDDQTRKRFRSPHLTFRLQPIVLIHVKLCSGIRAFASSRIRPTRPQPHGTISSDTLRVRRRSKAGWPSEIRCSVVKCGLLVGLTCRLLRQPNNSAQMYKPRGSETLHMSTLVQAYQTHRDLFRNSVPHPLATHTSTMLEELIEQWQIMRQAFAPMRLSRWQLAKLFAAQVHRDNPVAAKVAVLIFVVGLFWTISVLTRPRRLDKELGLPLIGGSRTLKNDFAAVVERGRQMVSVTDISKTSLFELSC
jgi:hypothetical protein